VEKSTSQPCLTVGLVRRPNTSRTLGLVRQRGISHALTVYSTESGAQCVIEVTCGWFRVPLEANVHHVHVVFALKICAPLSCLYFCAACTHLPSALYVCERLGGSSECVFECVHCLSSWEDGYGDGTRPW
jgi:hypothetical protein